MPDVENVTPVEADGAAQLEAPQVEVEGDAGGGDGNLAEGGLKALKAERERAKRLERELAQLRTVEQQRADAEKSELQKAVERAERAERAAQESARKVFAAEHGVPDGLLTGATPDDWQASAEALLAFRQAAQPVQQVAPNAAGVQGNTGRPVTTNGTEIENLTRAIAEANAAGDTLASIALKQQLHAAQRSQN